MTMRPPFTWLLVVLLVAVLTGQAASAYSMPCRGTTSCCCTVPATMDMAAHGAAGTAEEAGAPCCDTSPATPCDIERDPRPAALSFVPAPFAESGDAGLAADAWATAAVATDAPGHTALNTADRSDRGHPPLYLANLTILC